MATQTAAAPTGGAAVAAAGAQAQKPAIQPCRYKTGKTLGAGSYSVVKECVHIDTGRYYAAKVINKRMMSGREHMVRNEIAVLKRVSMGHQNILTLVDYFETMNNLYLVTDLALGGELFDRICRKGSYYESDAADLIRATLSAVAYLHDHGIVHRDLKPENLLFRTPEDNADLLIADFGLSRIMDEDAFHVLTTTCGTPGYMAPEIFKKTGHGKPVDVWAIGVITYFLLCGYTPFDRESNLEEMQAILAADYSFTPLEYWRGVSQAARQFIKQCLTIDPTARMTAHQALAHPWVSPDANTPVESNADLLPTVKKNFNARRTLHAAIDTIRAINKLREGGMGAAAAANGASAATAAARGATPATAAAGDPTAGSAGVWSDTTRGPTFATTQGGTLGAAPTAGHPAGHQTASPAAPTAAPSAKPLDASMAMPPVQQKPGEQRRGESTDVHMGVEGEPGEQFVGQGGDAMEIDGRGHGKGQTREMIAAQEQKIKETTAGLWSKARS